MFKKMLKYWMLLLALAMVIAACGGGAADEPADTATESEDTAVSEEEAVEEEAVEEEAPAEEEEAMDEVVTIEFWHAMADELGEVVDELVTRFNDSQEGVVVSATFQGSYDDTYNALLASFETDTAPNIVQNFDLASQTMIDTGRLIPAYELMAADGFDSAFLSRPFAIIIQMRMAWLAWPSTAPPRSCTTTYAMLEEAGVSPPAEGSSWCFSEMLAACDAIQASGVVR